jgi:hypothetical protein
LVHGKITGMSGLIQSLIFLDSKNRHHKYSIFAGLLLVGALFYHFKSGKRLIFLKNNNQKKLKIK